MFSLSLVVVVVLVLFTTLNLNKLRKKERLGNFSQSQEVSVQVSQVE